MPESLTLSPTADPRIFVDAQGTSFAPPPGWICLPPGDATLTRRVKQAGPSWAVVEKKGRKTFSKGLWAPAATVDEIRRAIEAERETPEYAKKRLADLARRERTQAEYELTFEREVLTFLRFSTRWQSLAERVASRVAKHATPVGSGTVARTKRISVDRRAEAAVIAWMRHQTTEYDNMKIARIKGERREVRRELAGISRAMLDLHRTEREHAAVGCALCQAGAPAAS